MNLTEQEINVEMEKNVLRIIRKKFKTTSVTEREYFKDANIYDVSDIVLRFVERPNFVNIWSLFQYSICFL